MSSRILNVAAQLATLEELSLRIHTLPGFVVGLMVEPSHPQNRNIGVIPFSGHIWILRVGNPNINLYLPVLPG